MESQHAQQHKEQHSRANAEQNQSEGMVRAFLPPPPVQLMASAGPEKELEATESTESIETRQHADPLGMSPSPPNPDSNGQSGASDPKDSSTHHQQRSPFQLKASKETKADATFRPYSPPIQKMDNGASQPVVQLKNFTDKYSDSSFQLSTKKKEAIYQIHKGGFTEYIGKTSQGVPTRFNQHKTEKGLDPGFGIEKLVDGTWTPFETATHEQYWIGEAGGKGVLLNKINALDKAKWNWFKTPTGKAHNANQESDLTDGHFL